MNPSSLTVEPEYEPTHVDTFIEKALRGTDEEKYASWFFNLKRMPSVVKFAYATWMDKYKLFCEYEGRRYRVTGCSRMGDVWLTTDFYQTDGYEKRVDVAKCSDWKPTV